MKYFQYIIYVSIVLAAAAFIASSGLLLNDYRMNYVRKIATESQNTTDKEIKLELLQKVAFLSPSEKHYLEAGLAAKEANRNKLSEYYLKKVSSDEGLYQLGNAYFESKEYQKAADSYQKVFQKNGNTEYRSAIAKAELYLGNFSEASKYCPSENQNGDTGTCNILNLINGKAVSDEADSKLANISKTKDQSSRVIAVYQYLKTEINPQVAEKYLSSNENQLNGNKVAYFFLAREAYSRKDYQKTIDYLLKAKEIDPYYPQVYEHLAEAYIKSGDDKAAAENRRILSTLVWN